MGPRGSYPATTQLFLNRSVNLRGFLRGFLRSFCGIKTRNSGCCWWESDLGAREILGLTVAMGSELAAWFHRPSPGAALNNQHLHRHAWKADETRRHFEISPSLAQVKGRERGKLIIQAVKLQKKQKIW